MIIYVLINDNNIITSYAKQLKPNHIPIENGIKVETDLNIDEVDLIYNYKLIDGVLIELKDSEKEPVIQQPTDAELLQNEILLLTEQNVDLDFRVLMLEFNLV